MLTYSNHENSRAGFSLVEVMVGGAVLTIAILLWSAVEIQHAQISQKGRQLSQVTSENQNVWKIVRNMPKCVIQLAVCEDQGAMNDPANAFEVHHPYQDVIRRDSGGNLVVNCGAPLPIPLPTTWPNPLTPGCSPYRAPADFNPPIITIPAATPAGVEFRTTWHALQRAIFAWPITGRSFRASDKVNPRLDKAYFDAEVSPKLERAGCLLCHNGRRNTPINDRNTAIVDYDFSKYADMVNGRPPQNIPLATPMILTSKLGQRMLTFRDGVVNSNGIVNNPASIGINIYSTLGTAGFMYTPPIQAGVPQIAIPKPIVSNIRFRNLSPGAITNLDLNFEFSINTYETIAPLNDTNFVRKSFTSMGITQ